MAKTKLQELYCETGKHKWTREPTRGKRPHNCPEHRKVLTEEHKAKLHDGREKKTRISREAQIQAILETPRGERCHCGIRPNMNDDDLIQIFRTGKICTNVGICPTLDHVMRMVYDYHRHEHSEETPTPLDVRTAA